MDMMTDGMKQYGFSAGDLKVIVSLEIGCALIYAIPQTAVLGAILLTGYLGGAVATHLRAGEIPKIAGPVVFGVLVWLGLFLRDPRLRKLLPFRR
jgi:Mn2+/Fe2+ NRAMP family transporter